MLSGENPFFVVKIPRFCHLCGMTLFNAIRMAPCRTFATLQNSDKSKTLFSCSQDGPVLSQLSSITLLMLSGWPGTFSTRQLNTFHAITVRMSQFLARSIITLCHVVRMARYICHLSDWGAMATINSRSPLASFPFANVFSISDGPLDNSTGRKQVFKILCLNST